MKKRLIFFVLLFFLLFSALSFVSAGLFNKKKITGEIISPINEALCMDSDGGLNYYLRGLVRGNITNLGEKYNGLIGQVYDFCVQLDENNTYPWINESQIWDSWNKYEIQNCDKNCAIYESYCKEGLILSIISKCPTGCFNGSCIIEAEDCNATTIENSFDDTDGDGCNAGTDSDCGGIENADGTGNTCFDGIDNDCDGMIDSLDDDLSCNINCGDRICGLYEKINYSKYYCPNDCINSEYCLDNDGGFNYYVYGAIVGLDKDGEGIPPGDYCLADGSGVMEGYCTSDGYVNFYSYHCPNGCKNGACIQPNITCVDLDRGLNYYVYGTIKGPNQDRMTNPPGDYCWEDGRGLMEAYCNKGYVDFYSYPCPNGCKNGRCVRNTLVKVLDSFI